MGEVEDGELSELEEAIRRYNEGDNIGAPNRFLDQEDYEEFVDHCQTHDLRPSTIIQYIKYLTYLGFDPLEKENLAKFKDKARLAAEERMRQAEGGKSSKDRFVYHSYLAVKEYLRAKGEDTLLELLPESRALNKPESRKQTLKWEKTEIDRLIECADGERDKLVITLLFYSGLRAFEVLNLTSEWLNFSKEDRIEIEIPSEYAKGQRGGGSEKAYLKKEVEKKLKDYITNFYDWNGDYESLYENLVGEEDDIFRPVFNFALEDPREKDYFDLVAERYQLNQMLRAVAEKAGISEAENISAHKLRRSFIHHVYNNTGKGVNEASQLARHSSTEITSKFYLQLAEQDKVETYTSVFG